jgi:hypothetical protein
LNGISRRRTSIVPQLMALKGRMTGSRECDGPSGRDRGTVVVVEVHTEELLLALTAPLTFTLPLAVLPVTLTGRRPAAVVLIVPS